MDEFKTKIERLVGEGLGPITEKWKSATRRSISYRQGLRYVLHGKLVGHGVVTAG